ncbi:MAG: hypothetical protein JWP86_1797 [Phenylobacterium sp.]|nr:hypothetical protein [Phenylobacterium sp.]
MSELPERTFVVVGEMPLEPPRPLTRLPSLTSEDERALWRAAPGVELTVCAGAGHDIPRQAPSEMMAVLRTALATVA